VILTCCALSARGMVLCQFSFKLLVYVLRFHIFVCIFYYILMKKLNSLKRCVRTTVVNSQN